MALRAAASRLNAPLRQQAGRRTIVEGWISKPNTTIKEGEVFRANGHLHGACAALPRAESRRSTPPRHCTRCNALKRYRMRHLSLRHWPTLAHTAVGGLTRCLRMPFVAMTAGVWQPFA